MFGVFLMENKKFLEENLLLLIQIKINSIQFYKYLKEDIKG
jgi:hypothetical protein